MNLSQKTGYFTKGYYCLFDQIISKINQGNNLEEIHSELKKIELSIDIIEKDSVYTFFKVLFNFVEYLLQKNDNKITIDENKFLEVMFYKEIELISEGLKYFYYIKGLKYFFSQDFSKAKIIFESLYKFLNELPYVDPLINNYFFFYTATLSELSYKNKLKDKKITKLENEIDSYKLILDDTNGIFYSKYLFILAEINRIKGLSYRDINDIYEQSFEIAKSKKLNMDIAIICEFSSKYNHFNKKTFLMEVYLKEAYSFYEKMSNFRKLSLIKKDITIDENIRSDSKKIITRNDVTSTNTNAISNTNDFISIIKELSDEINFNSLQEKLLKISLKNSGSQNAYLLFEKNGNLLVTAKYSIKNKDVEFFDNNFLENEKNVPQSVIYFVKRSLTHVSISNPKLDKLFENDTYLLSGKCKSLLCLPITNQGDFIGCLYLENTLSHNSFNNEIIEFLKLFLTHTSVYLKNSFFYTEMQALNEILKKNQDELELKITERTIDLIKAKEIAEAATTTKSDFLANMSHEIRTPMNAIIGIADLLAETPLKTEQTDFVKVIQNNSEILLSLINDILDFSKLEAGQIQLEQIEFSIYETIENIVEILSIKAQSKGIEIFSFIDPNIKFNLIGDQNKIKQVLMNLIGNSIKFTDSGEVFVLVERLQSDDFTKEALKISIIDTGLGISPENQKKII
jgi:signal transduction histidine kinase